MMRDHIQFDGDQVAITVTLVVKAGSVAGAKRHAIRHLNDWVCRPPLQPPFPNGTLLHYSFGDTTFENVYGDNDAHSMGVAS